MSEYYYRTQKVLMTPFERVQLWWREVRWQFSDLLDTIAEAPPKCRIEYIPCPKEEANLFLKESGEPFIFNPQEQ